jgi:Flp pilus assembly protein TadG
MLLMKPEANRIPRRPRTRAGFRSGNALLETALAMFVLLFVAMGMVEFGQYLYIKHAFNSAARDGARIAILSSATQTKLTSAITTTLAQANITFNSSWLTVTDLTTNTTVADISTATSGDTIQVALSVNYDTIPNVVRPLYTLTGQTAGIKNGKKMSGACAMLKE